VTKKNEKVIRAKNVFDGLNGNLELKSEAARSLLKKMVQPAIANLFV